MAALVSEAFVMCVGGGRHSGVGESGGSGILNK